MLTGLKTLFGIGTKKDSFSPTNIPAVPRKGKQADRDNFCDDAILRKLAKDYEAGKTKWVLASDMAELYDHIDAHNFVNKDTHKIVINIDSKIAEKLKTAIEKGEHFDNGAEIDWDDVSKLMGPAGVDGIVISVGHKSFDAAYVYNGMESFLSIKTPDGQTRNFDFGMEDNFKGLFHLIGHDKPTSKKADELNYTPMVF